MQSPFRKDSDGFIELGLPGSGPETTELSQQSDESVVEPWTPEPELATPIPRPLRYVGSPGWVLWGFSLLGLVIVGPWVLGLRLALVVGGIYAAVAIVVMHQERQRSRLLVERGTATRGVIVGHDVTPPGKSRPRISRALVSFETPESRQLRSKYDYDKKIGTAVTVLYVSGDRGPAMLYDECQYRAIRIASK